MYFGNYTRLVYLAQTDDPDLVERAEAAAARLGLSMIVERTGLRRTGDHRGRNRRRIRMTDDITEPGPDLGPDQGEVRERQATRRGGRRRGGPTLSTIWWRDIPAQLTGRSGDDQHKVLLHARFQHAIDRAAAVAGLTSTQDYVQQWRTSSSPLTDGDIEATLDQRCADIDDQYPRERLEALVANGGLDPASGDGRAADRRPPNHPSNPRSPNPPKAISHDRHHHQLCNQRGRDRLRSTVRDDRRTDQPDGSQAARRRDEGRATSTGSRPMPSRRSPAAHRCST